MINFLKKGNNLLFTGLILLTVVNIIQSFTTELLADEAYYWVYRQFMDWGYFDHPPMVAAWIYISNLFFENGELSVRFFSAFTLSATIYLIWKLIDHPQKKEYTWLFLLIVLSTALFNVYGFITVPDTPLLFFMAIFLFGYKKYLQEKSWLSCIILAISMAGMLYSKYQAVLIIFFVLLSNLKVLKDYKIWLTTLGTILLFFPHLYWQYVNDFPSIKYHLFERKGNTVYRFRDTYMHIINMMAIIGFTFPLVYKSLYKNLKNKELFNKALNFIAIGFVVFFFISTFKGHVQAQWIVAISIPLIIIPFNYLIQHKKEQKLFIKLAIVTLSITTFLRVAMANDGLLPHQFEMHGNKTWVTKVDSLVKDETPVFVNSYQNTSAYWFYSGKRPYQYNTWGSRKNQYDFFSYNSKIEKDTVIQIGGAKKYADYSVKKRNNGQIYLQSISGFTVFKDLLFSTSNEIKITKNKENIINIDIYNPYTKIALKKLEIIIYLKNDNNQVIQECKATLNSEIIKGKSKNSLRFLVPKLSSDAIVTHFQIVGLSNPKMDPYRLSKKINCHFNYEK